ncbi:MAG: hypothetical protein KJ950_04735 [Proteobacteria bacterium]|nr:hypothetical protein [Pseudomonadota bacterium]MBU1688574.1 hypothetical protein [Pseudomonadota bacterium]
MDECDRLRLLAELTTAHCELNHGPGTRNNDYPAENFIVLPVGYEEENDLEVTARELVIPICVECAEALTGDEWTLLYCFECGENRWVARELAKNRYRHHILWLRGCPECSNQFGGLYFGDLEEQVTFRPTGTRHPSYIVL